jgi:hypothetical protein
MITRVCYQVDKPTLRPRNKEELFNLRHASLRNVVERIFGIVKRRFRILLLAPEYAMDIQARIPAALCALHNFIRFHDPGEIDEFSDGSDMATVIDHPRVDVGYTGDLARGPPGRPALNRATKRRDEIAQKMWDSYQNYLECGGDPHETWDANNETDTST